MRILLVSPSVPSPTWGFGTRVYQFLRLLSRRHEVSLLAYAQRGDEDKVTGLQTFCAGVYTILRSESTTTKRAVQARSLLSTTSYQWRNMYSRAMQRTLDELPARHRFDVIQLESSQLAGFEFDPRAVLVVDEHNIEYELLYRMFQTESSAVRRAYN